MTHYHGIHIPHEGTLYSPENEKDSCGTGFVAHIKGKKSHEILKYALRGVCNMMHRGAVDADMKTGDGAGVCTQIPQKIMMAVARELGAEPETPEEIGVGMFFLPQDGTERLKVKILAEGAVRNRKLRVMGWRDVPVNEKELGEKAKVTKPHIAQLLILRPVDMDGDTFERNLFLIRREIERKCQEEKLNNFVASLSHRTIVYKAMVVPAVLPKFYYDLHNEEYETAVAVYHQRFSTNTFPSWPLCQPFRMLGHNGEINTVRGNRNWWKSRASDFVHESWKHDMDLLTGIIDPKGSDSMSLDNALELLVHSGRDITHAMSLLVPPAWQIDPTTSPELADYYRYTSCFTEPWDGPAALVYTDGRMAAASLDRNGLRPARFKVTADDIFSVGSEVGAVELPRETVVLKGRLAPGEMVAVDLEKGELIFDATIKERLSKKFPCAEWIKENRVDIISSIPSKPHEEPDALTLSQRQVAFGWNAEEVDMSLVPMLEKGEEATYSMGDDTPLAVLSTQPRLLFTYFKQLFAQVTNPPIDPIRERGVMSIESIIGWKRNLLQDGPENTRVVHLENPFLTEDDLVALQKLPDFPCRTIDTTWPLSEGSGGLEKAVARLCEEAEQAVHDDIRILILSDRAIDHDRVALPSLVATGAVHHHLNRINKRMRLGLVVDTGEARDTHHMACLIGYGASAICPWLAYQTIQETLERDKTARRPRLEGVDFPTAVKRFRYALEKGVLKVMSKMGISVLTSYQGAQIFEAVGLGEELVAKCFTGTHSRISGIGFDDVANESLARHDAGFLQAVPEAGRIELTDPGYYRWRRAGEIHSISGPVIKNFHTFVRTGDADKYEDYVKAQLENRPVAIKDLFEFTSSAKPIPLEHVEPIEDIRVRFTTAAMSLGALSPEAHEALAIAMNRIGGKSNSGEGGEESRRFKPYENNDWAISKIKQVASGRFGVSAEYLANAEELEIKMAQGAKPGEGGQLPGHKVNGIIAKLRHTVAGVTLISPPPHHDIYSIEDLAQLIHDLKEVNPRARVCVKLVAENGVGTIAAGVAKAKADIILISGHDGGTGASPLSSIKNAGLPWELGLAETQQTLMMNNLRERVTLRTDGGLRNGKDIITAAILGAEEYNFGTIALIALGCVYVRQCHLNTCPVGVATQDPRLRAKFKGDPQHVVNFFNAVADECRHIMAKLGVVHLDDLIGRPEFLRIREVPHHPKANKLNLSPVLRNVAKEYDQDIARTCRVNRNEKLGYHPLDDKILQQAHVALTDQRPVTLSFKVKNRNRNIGTKLSGEIAYQHGNHGLPENTITLNLEGSAGQSLGTFLTTGVKIILTGEANDYVGKGMCGGEIVILPPRDSSFTSWENSIIGNTVMYGATGGRLYAAGLAGERFCVRNSGGFAVVEGVGDHACEYMTGGTVVILGGCGKNFGAGMSGGVAYLLDEKGLFPQMVNPDMVKYEGLSADDDEILKGFIREHGEKTGSHRASHILDKWEEFRPFFVKVSPKFVPKPVEGDEVPVDTDDKSTPVKA